MAGAAAKLGVDRAQLTGSGGVTGAGTVEVSDALLLATGTPYDVGRTELTYGRFLAFGDGTVGRTGGLDAVPQNGFLPAVEGDLEVGPGPSRLGGITFDDGDVFDRRRADARERGGHGRRAAEHRRTVAAPDPLESGRLGASSPPAAAGRADRLERYPRNATRRP